MSPRLVWDSAQEQAPLARPSTSTQGQGEVAQTHALCLSSPLWLLTPDTLKLPQAKVFFSVRGVGPHCFVPPWVSAQRWDSVKVWGVP